MLLLGSNQRLSCMSINKTVQITTRQHVNKLVVENCFKVRETLLYYLNSTETK